MNALTESGMTATELERTAYAAGNHELANAYARIAELEEKVEALEEPEEVETLENWELQNGPADAYKEFFDDCFKRLSVVHPWPNVESNDDKNVVFEAIERGENAK